MEIILDTPLEKIRVRSLTSHALRFTFTADDNNFPTDRPWMEHVFLPQPEPTPDDTTHLEVETADGELRVRRSADEEVFFKARLDRSPSHPGLNISTHAGESFYGGGEWFNAFRRKEGRVRLKVREAPSLSQGFRTYSTIPFFLSSRGYAIFLLSSRTSDWRLEPQQNRLSISVEGQLPDDFILIDGPDFKSILRTYTRLTGRPPLPPIWAFGLWVTSYPQGPQEEALEHVRRHRERNLPLDAVILDYHWEERFHNFRWRRELIPDPQGLIDNLKDLGVRLGLILTPFENQHNLPLQKMALQVMAHDIPEGMVLADDRALPEYHEALDNGYLAHPDATWWFGRGGMIDFTNPAAAAWWNAHLRPLYDQGVAFFKNDDGEYLPENASSSLGMDGAEHHNLYGFFYGRAMYEGMADLDQRRALVYARSVWAGSQRYPALFLGDQQPTFECLRRTLRAGMNLALAGFSYWTADVFGLDGKTTPETFQRYAQWALFTPVARYFWRPPKIDSTRFPWSHGAKAEMNFRFYADLRYRLLPYYYALAREASQTGIPIMRPLVLEFDPFLQVQEKMADVYDQVMLGSGLMLAPVVQAKAEKRKVFLPPGTWYDFWSGETWLGPVEILYPAPLERLPLFARGGNIIPLAPSGMQSIPNSCPFDRLELHVFPPYPAEFTLYEDDGCTRAYQEGEFASTRMAARLLPGNPARVEIQIFPAEGTYAGIPARRSLEVVCHAALPPSRVEVDGKLLEEWAYDPQLRTLSLKLEVETRRGALVHIFSAREEDEIPAE